MGECFILPAERELDFDRTQLDHAFAAARVRLEFDAHEQAV